MDSHGLYCVVFKLLRHEYPFTKNKETVGYATQLQFLVF